MMAQTFVYNSGKSEVSKHEIQIECGIFFDGTLNSKYNTLLRRMVKEGKPRKAKEEEKVAYYKGSKRSFIDQQGVDNSYSNDYTNVARLWEYCEPDYRIYIEGIGAVISKESDQLEEQMSTGDQDDGDGFMFGAGKAGIRAKVRKACRVLAKIVSAKKDNNSKKKRKIKITLDVFGFSRGAAAARSFVHEVNVMKAYEVLGYLEQITAESFRKDQKVNLSLEKERIVAIRDGIPTDPMGIAKDVPLLDHDGELVSRTILDQTKGRLPKMGHLGYILMDEGLTFDEVENIELIVRFVGVYDTVSSYYKEGSIKNYLAAQMLGGGKGNMYFADDVKELHLNDLGRMGQAVHFTAMDEHRYNFALTKMPGAIEKQFPGVHCDIGGAYLNEKELVDEIEIAIVPEFNFTNMINKKNDIQTIINTFKRGYYSKYAVEELQKYRGQLIYNHWFKEDQLFIDNVNSFTYEGKSYKTEDWYYKLSGIRYLRKEYSFIPLLFMGEYFRKQLGTSAEKCFSQESDFIVMFSVNEFNVLKKAMNHLRPYVMDNKGKPWEYSSFESVWLKNEILEKKQKRLWEIMIRRAEEDEAEYQKNNNPYKREESFDKIDYENKRKADYYSKEKKIDKKTQQKVVRSVIELNRKIEDAAQPKIDKQEERDTKLMYPQGILEILRNEYLHWSANKDWFGMQPTSDRTRTKY